MVRIEKMKAAVFAAVAACAGIAFAGVGESFESMSGDLSPSGTSDVTWTGDGSVATLDPVLTTAPGGFPISGADHAKALSIDGEVGCVNSGTAGGSSQIDLLMKVDEPGDDLSGETIGDGKIAVAAGNSFIETGDVDSVALKAYCSAKGAEAAWVDVGKITTGAWHRVTLKFDYAKNLCQISIDGIPATSEHGYLDPAKTSNATANGSWYGLVTETVASSSVAQITFSGCAYVDDVVITDANGTAPEPSGNATIASGEVSGSSIPLSKLAEWGVDATTINSAKLDSTGMTVAEKLACGLEPTGNVAFKATAMTLNSAGVPTITFPGSATAKNGVTPTYTIKVYDGSKASTDDGYDVTSSFTQGTVESAGGVEVSASMTPKSGAALPKVLKFKVTAGTAAAASGN